MAAEFLNLFASVFLPMFMAAVDQTLLATATPAIAESLGGLRDMDRGGSRTRGAEPAGTGLARPRRAQAHLGTNRRLTPISPR